MDSADDDHDGSVNDSTEKEGFLLSKILKKFMWALKKIKIPIND